MTYFEGLMSSLRRQVARRTRVCQTLTGFALLLLLGPLYAGEAEIDSSDDGSVNVEDSILGDESPTGESPLLPENLLDPGLAHIYMGPLADAVSDAHGKATALHLLGTDVEPGTSQRLTWSATELFRRRFGFDTRARGERRGTGANLVPDSGCSR